VRKLRAKLVVGKCHTIEYGARIFLTGRNAFLVGHTIFRRVDKKLSRSDKSYDRKQPKRYRQETVAVVDVICEGRFKLTNDVFGKIAATAAAICGERKLIKNFDVKNDWVCRLNNSCRRTVSRISYFVTARAMVVGLGTENVYVLFTSEEHDLFVYRCYAFKFKRLIISNTRFKRDLNIISDIYRVKTTVESNGVYTDVSPRDASFFSSDVSCSCDDILPIITCIDF
jgi:hypothetical protein